MKVNDEIKIKALIVDDEKKACANLKDILIEYIDPEIIISGIAYNTKEAEMLIAEYHPNVVFLDIEMPNENAFAFLDRIAPFYFEVIFVTAYDEYAIKAFKLNAIDYILKPISVSELKNAVSKLREKFKFKQLIKENELSYLEISSIVTNKAKTHKITLKDAVAVEIVDFKDICFIEAEGSYSKVFFLRNGKMKEMVMSSPLSDYEDMLPADLFYRIHRSYLINCFHINKIIHDGGGQVLIREDFMLPVSRRRFPALIEFLKNNDVHNV